MNGVHGWAIIIDDGIQFIKTSEYVSGRVFCLLWFQHYLSDHDLIIIKHYFGDYFGLTCDEVAVPDHLIDCVKPIKAAHAIGGSFIDDIVMEQ